MTGAAAASEDATARAAALLDAAPGLYSLRKRRRDSSQPATSPTTAREDPQGHVGGHESPSQVRSPEVALTAADAMAADAAAPQADKPQLDNADTVLAHRDSSATGSLHPEQQFLPTASRNQSGSGDADNDDDDDDDDDSSLTSLSDLEERFHLASPKPAHNQRSRTTNNRKKAPQKRKTATSTASSPSAMTTPSAGSEYRPDATEPSDDDDYHEDFASPLPMEVESPQPRGAGTESRKVLPVKRRAGNPPPRAGPSKARQPLTPASNPLTAHLVAPNSPQSTQAVAAAQMQADQHVAIVAPPPQAPKRKRAPPAAKTSSPTTTAGVPQERSVSLFSGMPRLISDFRPAAMPTVMDLYERRHQILQDARLEATRDVDLQRKSEEQIETAIRALDGGDQQTGLCLAMNRYSAFCALGSVDVPPFPITATKVALFLARAPTTALSTLLLSVFPQPATYPLPIAGTADPILTPEEGSRVSRELVRFWVEALAYAQRATFNIWAPILRGSGTVPADGQRCLPLLDDRLHPSLEPIQDAVAIREVCAAVETSESILRSEEHARQAREELRASIKYSDSGAPTAVPAPPSSRQGKTKWTKGGRSVAPPPPSSSSSGRTTSSDLVLARSASDRRTGPPPETVLPTTRDNSTKPVEYWQVTNAQVPPILPIASAPISLSAQHASVAPQPAPVASASHEPFDPAHRRRNTTSDLALIDPWVTVPNLLGEPQQDPPHRGTDFPRPISIDDANALQGVLSEQNLSPWAREFLQQASHVPPEPTRRHSRASTYGFELQSAPWVSPYESVHQIDTVSSPKPMQQAVQPLLDHAGQDVYTGASPAADGAYGAYGAYGVTSGDSQGHGISSFDLLAAVANDYMSADLDASTLPRDDRGMNGGESVTLAPLRHGIDQYAQSGQDGLQTSWTPSGSTRHGSPAEPFNPSPHDPSLSELLAIRYQPHAPTFVDANSRFGRIVDNALASISHLNPVSAAGGGARPSQQQIVPPVRPPPYPTPDSPSVGRWPIVQQDEAAHGPWSAVPLTGLDAVLLPAAGPDPLAPVGAATAVEQPALEHAAAVAASPSHFAAYGLGLSYV